MVGGHFSSRRASHVTLCHGDQMTTFTISTSYVVAIPMHAKFPDPEEGSAPHGAANWHDEKKFMVCVRVNVELFTSKQRKNGSDHCVRKCQK